MLALPKDAEAIMELREQVRVMSCVCLAPARASSGSQRPHNWTRLGPSKMFLGEAAAQLAELATAGPRFRYAVDRALRR